MEFTKGIASQTITRVEYNFGCAWYQFVASVRLEIDLIGAAMLPMIVINLLDLSTEGVAKQIGDNLRTQTLLEDQVQLMDLACPEEDEREDLDVPQDVIALW